jgi:uncharacterized protein (TIGR00369 family)
VAWDNAAVSDHLEPTPGLNTERSRRLGGSGIWRTLGYELRSWQPRRAVVAWQATTDYCFASESGHVVQGGLVTALLDAAMASACWTVLDEQHVFLTADLRVEFLRSAPVGELVATGTVVRATRRVLFCAAELHDTNGRLLASSRGTPVVLPAPRRTPTGPASIPAVTQDC